MGLDSASTKFLCAARSCGADFDSVLTIGRQHFFPEEAVLDQIFRLHGVGGRASEMIEAETFAEPFFKALGADRVESLDYSDYEGADFVQDMNLPIPADLKGRFTCVYDGGTIEHVFNAPQALKNSLEMVKLGGCFLQANIANNFMGHGFWQFSPELLFRVCAPENGFRVKAMLLHEVKPNGRWFSVSDPDEVKTRVELCNDCPTYIMTMAEKVADLPVFQSTPVQSDYEAAWTQVGQEASQDDAVQGLLRRQPAMGAQCFHEGPRRSRIERWKQSIQKRLPSRSSGDPFNRSYFKEIAEANLLAGEF